MITAFVAWIDLDVDAVVAVVSSVWIDAVVVVAWSEVDGDRVFF